MKARIVGTNSHIYEVLLENNERLKLKPQGKIKQQITKLKAGDIVEVEGEQIVNVYPRRNELVRPPVANIDYLYLVISAAEPTFSFYLLDLFLAYAISHKIEASLIVTKCDLLTKTQLNELKQELTYYKEELNIKIYYNNEDNTYFAKNTFNVLMGQTGAGKSTFLNKIKPELNLATSEISKALNRGKHTTRNINFYEINGAYIADTPGFSALEINIKKEELRDCFLDFKDDCYFKDCLHLENSKGCSVRENTKIKKSRYTNYLKILRKLEEEKWN